MKTAIDIIEENSREYEAGRGRLYTADVVEIMRRYNLSASEGLIQALIAVFGAGYAIGYNKRKNERTRHRKEMQALSKEIMENAVRMMESVQRAERQAVYEEMTE